MKTFSSIDKCVNICYNRGVIRKGKVNYMYVVYVVNSENSKRIIANYFNKASEAVRYAESVDNWILHHHAEMKLVA